MKVWIIYEKDGYGGSQVGTVYSSEDAAIRDRMDKFNYLKRSKGFTEEQLMEEAKEHIEEVGIEKAYQEAKETMGIKLEFDSININKEFGFGESED